MFCTVFENHLGVSLLPDFNRPSEEPDSIEDSRARSDNLAPQPMENNPRQIESSGQGAASGPEHVWLAKPMVSYGALAGLLGVAMLFNLTLPPVFKGVRWDPGWLQFAFFAAGGLVAQFALLAIWASLGTSDLKLRIPISVGLCLACVCMFILGLEQPLSGRLAIVLMAVGAAIGGFSIMCAALVGVRWFGGYRMVHVQAVAGLTSPKVSIKYLLWATTGVALLIALFRAAFPTEGGSGPPSVMVVVLLITQHCVYSVVLSVGCLLISFGIRRTYRGLLFAQAVIFGITPVNLFLLNSYPRMSVGMTEVLNMYAFAAGLVAVLCLFFLVARKVGFRLEAT